MKEKEKQTPKAGEDQPGPEQTKTRTLYELGATLGLTKDSIDETTRRRNKALNCLLIAIALGASMLSYALLARPGHYIGISTQDFNTIGQMMYGVFGRLF